MHQNHFALICSHVPSGLNNSDYITIYIVLQGITCLILYFVPKLGKRIENIVAAFRGKHVSPAKHRYAWLPKKCDYRDYQKVWQPDRQTPDKVIPMCRYASQATQ